MNIGTALKIIAAHKQFEYGPPESYYSMPKARFIQKSYNHSGILMLEKFLKEHPKWEAISATDYFRSVVLDKAYSNDNPKISYMASVWSDVAVDMLDHFLFHQERRQKKYEKKRA